MISLLHNKIYLYRNPDNESEGDVIIDTHDDSDSKEKKQEKRVIICRECLNFITDPDNKIEMNGYHFHSFANPHGFIFQIGCFRSAKGCSYVGEFSNEFTWFKGFHWQISVCSTCGTHMGWLFSSGNNRFIGLIYERLIVP